MENKKIRDLELDGLVVTSVLSLLNMDDIDGGKLTTLINLHDSDANTSFESASNKQIQLQSLLTHL